MPAHVLLAGPVDLLRASGFVGRGQLKFNAIGETVLLSFGSEDGMRAIRQLEQKQDEARLTGRRTTRHLVRIYLSNASSEAARIVLEERIPVSEVKEVEVQVIQKECKPAPASISKDGIARIELACAAGATLEAAFVWDLSAAAKVAGILEQLQCTLLLEFLRRLCGCVGTLVSVKTALLENLRVTWSGQDGQGQIGRDRERWCPSVSGRSKLNGREPRFH